MVVPKHTAALDAETPLGIAHFRRFVILIKLDCGNIDPGKIVNSSFDPKRQS